MTTRCHTTKRSMNDSQTTVRVRSAAFPCFASDNSYLQVSITYYQSISHIYSFEIPSLFSPMPLTWTMRSRLTILRFVCNVWRRLRSLLIISLHFRISNQRIGKLCASKSLLQILRLAGELNLEAWKYKLQTLKTLPSRSSLCSSPVLFSALGSTFIFRYPRFQLPLYSLLLQFSANGTLL